MGPDPTSGLDALWNVAVSTIWQAERSGEGLQHHGQCPALGQLVEGTEVPIHQLNLMTSIACSECRQLWALNNNKTKLCVSP